MDKKINIDKNSPQEEGKKMPALAPAKKKPGLTPKKKEELKQMMGKYSGKASLSLLNEMNRNETN